jgi:hypothetical protein
MLNQQQGEEKYRYMLCDKVWTVDATEDIDPAVLETIWNRQEAALCRSLVQITAAHAESAWNRQAPVMELATDSLPPMWTLLLPHACLTAALQVQPRCPTCRSGATVNQIRLPERVDTDEGSVFPVKLKTLTGGV